MLPRPATELDIPRLLPLMRDFYDFEHLPFDEGRTIRLLHQLITDHSLGRVILLEQPPTLLGYLILGFGFSLEFHGRDALLDEFYILPQHRGQGIGSAALKHSAQLCRSLGIAVLHLEADHFNDRAHDFYKRHGFDDHSRHLMTEWL